MERGEGGGFTWGGVEGWGEKAYNCICITIKKINEWKKKKKKKKPRWRMEMTEFSLCYSWEFVSIIVQIQNGCGYLRNTERGKR